MEAAGARMDLKDVCTGRGWTWKMIIFVVRARWWEMSAPLILMRELRRKAKIGDPAAADSKQRAYWRLR